MAFPTGWTHRFTVTIDGTKVTGSPTGFVFLVTKDMLPSTVIDAGSTSAQEGGGDLRFTADLAGTTLLPIEVVDFSPNAVAGSRRCEIHVNMFNNEPTAGVDKLIYGWCDGPNIMHQPAPSNLGGAERVWSDMSYRGVHHLNNSYAPEAGGLWLLKPTATEYNGATYKVWLDFLSGSPGRIKIAKYVHATGVWSYADIAAATQQDGHAGPTICISATGYIHVSWANFATGASNIKTIKSTNPEDISAWGGIVAVDPVSANERAYVSVAGLASGDLVLTVRDSGAWWRRTSTDGGATWGNQQSILGGVDRTYAHWYLDATGRLHLTWHVTTGVGTIGNKIGYAYSDNPSAVTSTWKAADGTTLSLPIDPAAAVSVSTGRVFDNTGFNGDYILGGGADGSGNPAIAAWLVDTGTLANSNISSFKYSGGVWTRTAITIGAGVGVSTGAGPTGRGEGDIWFVSGTTWRCVAAVTVSSIVETQLFESTDNCATWSKIADLTTGSSFSNVQPQYVTKSTGPIQVVLYGCSSDNVSGVNYNVKSDIWFAGTHTDLVASWARSIFPTSRYYRDSSVKRVHGSAVGTPTGASAAFPWGGGGQTVASGSYALMTTQNAIASELTNSFTIMQWIKPSASGTTAKFSSKGASGGSSSLFQAYRNTSNGVQLSVGNGTTFSFVASGTNPLTAGVSSRVVLRYDGSIPTLRIGNAVSTAGSIAAPLTAAAGSNVFMSGETFVGSFGGFRMTPTVVSTDTLATEYENQNSPSTFAVGAESPIDAGGTTDWLVNARRHWTR